MPSVEEALDAEWAGLADSRRGRRAVVRWAETHPVFRHLRNLGDVLELRRDEEAGGAVLAALADLAPDDELAARTLLQAVLPGLVRLQHLGRRDPEMLDELISLAWVRIRTYPSGLRGSVPGRILMDVSKHYRQAYRAIEVSSDDLDQLPARRVYGGRTDGRSAEDEALERVMVGNVVAAWRRGVVSDDEMALVVRTRFLGAKCTDIAREQRVNHQTLQQRRWRAEQRLMAELRPAS